MNQKIVSLSIEKTLDAIKNQVLNNKGRIVGEEQKRLFVEHGDWETSFNLVPQDSNTRVVTETKLKTSHAAIFGVSFVAVIFTSIFVWFSVTTLRSQIAQQQNSISGWFAELFGYSGYQEMNALVGILEIMGYFMVALGAILGITLVYIYYKKESFTEKILMLLPQ